MIRTLIVDDSAYSRRTLKTMLESTGEVQVIGTARDGEEGLKKAFEMKPDAITLDLDMPRMDGCTFLRIIMKYQPTPIIVVSARREDLNVFKALELGAVDFIPKPTDTASPALYSLRDDLLIKFIALATINLRSIQKRLIEPPVVLADKGEHPDLPRTSGQIKAVAIGASTGGPSAIQRILSELPADVGVGILVSQHMPPGFTQSFAERLDHYTALQVKEAEPGDHVCPGNVLIAPGGHSIFLNLNDNKVSVSLVKKRPEDRYVPSADIMFGSAAKIFGDRLLGIILTGMGSDGTEGLAEIKRKGGKTLAEAFETAVIFGMPREAIEGGSVDKIVPLSKISREIIGWARSKH